jgi:hypothetical protein
MFTLNAFKNSTGFFKADIREGKNARPPEKRPNHADG